MCNWAASWQNQQNGMCAQRRLRPAWASVQSDQSSLCAQWVAKDPSFLHADSEDSDQTGRMPRLIWVFAGGTCHFVGFVTMRLVWLWRCVGIFIELHYETLPLNHNLFMYIYAIMLFLSIRIKNNAHRNLFILENTPDTHPQTHGISCDFKSQRVISVNQKTMKIAVSYLFCQSMPECFLNEALMHQHSKSV